MMSRRDRLRGAGRVLESAVPIVRGLPYLGEPVSAGTSAECPGADQGHWLLLRSGAGVLLDNTTTRYGALFPNRVPFTHSRTSVATAVTGSCELAGGCARPG
ncbi:hypothetical protein GCM10018954_038590 [Kutzneria kofuensis]